MFKTKLISSLTNKDIYPDYLEPDEDENQIKLEYIHQILATKLQFPLQRPADLPDQWDRVKQQAGLDGDVVAIDTEERMHEREA
ncbi:hypothetical protein NW762_012695 [Fusarium torreyae]|uniref:Uncharacterized protein n=1 Tax=Fusarium torreyae TaxID=1237075 RepID=A0A9W8V826_9HYPO|nr:hypothetical protein NW762_012695 [Fusarium torreyae]